jgi:hypothetical protein
LASIVNSDNGVVSGSAGLKSSADSSGVLDLQTNGTTAISISASQVVTYTNQPTYTGGTANGVMYLNGSKAVTTGTALVFDGANLGLGVTPSVWNSGYKVVEIGKIGSSVFTGASSGNLILASNAYLNSSDAWTYANNGGAVYFRAANSDRSFSWNISSTGAGTAGNPITFSQVMTLDSTGALFINRASNGVHLQTQVNSVNTTALGSFNGAPTVGSNLSGYSGIMFNGASLEPTLDGLNTRQSALVDIGSTGFRFKTGHFTGINFPATQVASADANTLDDYEEGVYTPTVTAGTSGTITINASYDILTYTKIGRLVTITGLLVVGSVSSPVGELRISLPFTPASFGDASLRQCPACVCYFNGAGAPNGSVYYPAAMFINQSPLSYFTLWAASLSNVYNTAPASWCGSGSDLQISLTYVTAS